MNRSEYIFSLQNNATEDATDDEKSGKEDNIAVHNQTGKQLSARAELHQVYNQEPNIEDVVYPDELHTKNESRKLCKTVSKK